MLNLPNRDNPASPLRRIVGRPVLFAAVAHQVEQQTENLCVAGSSPARGTSYFLCCGIDVNLNSDLMLG